MGRTIVILVVLGLAIGSSVAGYWYLGRWPAHNAEEELETIRVARGDMFEMVTATGQVQPQVETKLAFDVSGKVVELAVAEGDKVSEGQILARLDSSDLVLRVSQARQTLAIKEALLVKAQKSASDEEIRAARAELESAQANYQRVLNGPTEEDLTIARADLERAQAALKKAQADYDRVSWMGGVEAMPQSVALEQATIDYQRALASYRKVAKGPTESDLKAAQAQVARAQATLEGLLNRPSPEDVEISRLEVEQARAALAQAEADLAGAEIKAPHSGVVAQVAIKEQEWVTAGAPVIVLVDDSRLHVDVLVDEVDMGKVQEGQKVNLRLDSFPERELEGRVDFIAPAPTNNAGLISYKVSIGLERGDLPVRVGMTASAEIIARQEKGILVIPNRAIEVDRESGGYYVAKLVSGAPIRTEIKLGLRGETESQVLSGLEEGDEVAILTVSSRERLRQIFSGGGGQ